MNTKRISKLVVATIFVFAVIFAIQVLYNPGGAMKNSPKYVGMGDLRRFEAAQNLPKTSFTTHDQSYVGMGDLRCYEFELEERNSK